MTAKNIWAQETRNPDWAGPMGLLFNQIEGQRYPVYMYLVDVNRAQNLSEEIRVVNDTSEEMAAREQGYDNVHAGMMSNKVMVNWFWDLEDFSPKQLVIFAKEEFDVDLPIDAPQLVLLECVLRLTKHAPQNSNRIVLMAHTIKMNYDETLDTIRKLTENVKPEFVMEFVA